jgi:N utilization substance protein A
VTTVESLADMTPEQLEAIEGIGPKTVEKISLAVNNYFASLEAGEAAEGEVTAEGVAVEGEAVTEEAAVEASAEGEQTASAESEKESAASETTEEESKPEEGSTPESTE